MKKTLILVLGLLVCLTSGNAQKVEFSLDYTATYAIEDSQDSISVSVGGNGKYLFTDSPLITKNFEESFSKFLTHEQGTEFRMKLLINMSTLDMLMHANSGQQVIAANVNLENFVEDNSKKEGNNQLLADKTDEYVEVLGKKYTLMAVYPDNKPDDILYVAFDKDYGLDYTTFLEGMLKAITGKSITLHIPEGIVVYAREKGGKEILRLTNIENIDKTGAIDFSLTIE